MNNTQSASWNRGINREVMWISENMIWVHISQKLVGDMNHVTSSEIDYLVHECLCIQVYNNDLIDPSLTWRADYTLQYYEQLPSWTILQQVHRSRKLQKWHAEWSTHQLPHSMASSTAASSISASEGWTNKVIRGIPSGYLD